MIDIIERKITVFGIDQNLQFMAITDEPDDWRTPFIRCLQGERSNSLKEMARLEVRARFYYLMGDVLYRKTLLPMDAKCLSRQEENLVLREAHEGGCAEHTGARSLA